MEDKKCLDVIFLEESEMTEAQEESVASLLFEWWRRDYEKDKDIRMQSNPEIECDR